MQRGDGKNLIFRVVVAALAVCVAAFALLTPLIAATIVAYDGRRTVVIDAGHGGADAGVVGVRTGAKESHLNLQVALLLGEYLKSGGIRVVYTRVGDVMHSHPKVADNKKRADMFYRGDVINGARPDAVISVHMNFYSSSARRGAQVFYAKNEGDGKALAAIAQDILNRDINDELGGREYSALPAEKYILTCSPYPTVIAECGFLSNPLDEAKLVDPAFQARLAYALFQAVAIFLSGRATS